MDKWCKCISVTHGLEMLPFLIEEIGEFIEEPSIDEFSDVMWSLSRMVGGWFGVLYIAWFPFLTPHLDKIEKRMAMYGCVHSVNHIHCTERR